MRKFGALAVCLALTLLSACSGGRPLPSDAAPRELADPSESYRLEPGNRIRVSVFNQANLSGDFQLDPGGNVAMPLLGNIRASGLTGRQFGERLAELLTRDGYMREPRVGVEIVTFRPFYVLGEVRQPGEFPYTTGMTVLSAVARAGGYDYRAREGDVILVRMIEGKQVEYRADERTPILPGDIIRVTERKF